MQPLVSPVDHESRQNSYRAHDDDVQGPSEDTPLIHRFPASSVQRQRGPLTTAVVSILLLILVSGVIIGIYLLILQNAQENVLPPVEAPLMIVRRMQWDNVTPQTHPYSQFKAQHLLTMQTDTRECSEELACDSLLREMQSAGKEMLYNFLVSSNGQMYEALGWRAAPQYQNNSTLVLAFIGNFTETPPSSAQMKATETFFDFAVSRQHLQPSFVIIGKNTKYSPKYLYQSLRKYRQWNSELSDE